MKLNTIRGDQPVPFLSVPPLVRNFLRAPVELQAFSLLCVAVGALILFGRVEMYTGVAYFLCLPPIYGLLGRGLFRTFRTPERRFALGLLGVSPALGLALSYLQVTPPEYSLRSPGTMFFVVLPLVWVALLVLSPRVREYCRTEPPEEKS